MTASSPSGAAGILRSVGRNLGWLLASRGVVAVLSLVYLAIVTRTLGIANFGRFALITGASQALAMIVSFQTWQIIVQYGTAHLAAGDEARLAALARLAAILDAISACIGAALAVFILARWADRFGVTPTHARATLIFTIVQLLSIRSTPVGLLRMRDRFSLAAIADSVTPAVRLVGAVAAALIYPSTDGFLAAWGSAEILTAAAFWGMLARTGDLRLLFAGRWHMRGVRADNPGIVRFAINTNAIATLGVSGKQVPLLLSGIAGGAASAGGFRLAAQLAQALTKLSQLLARAAFPEIVRAIRIHGLGAIGATLWRVVILSLVAAAVMFGVIAVAGHSVLHLMGHGFGESYPILLWLGAAGCLDLVSVSFEPLLMATHRAGMTFAARVVAIAAMFATAALLGPGWGPTGIAIAVLVNSATAALLLAGIISAVLRRARHVGHDGVASPPRPHDLQIRSLRKHRR